jgi:hypothetical protein
MSEWDIEARRERQAYDQVRIIVDRIKPQLACLPVPMQGKALADLLADWLAEQCYVADPAVPKSVRDERLQIRNELLKDHIEMVRQLVRGRGPGGLSRSRSWLTRGLLYLATLTR